MQCSTTRSAGRPPARSCRRASPTGRRKPSRQAQRARPTEEVPVRGRQRACGDLARHHVAIGGDWLESVYISQTRAARRTHGRVAKLICRQKGPSLATMNDPERRRRGIPWIQRRSQISIVKVYQMINHHLINYILWRTSRDTPIVHDRSLLPAEGYLRRKCAPSRRPKPTIPKPHGLARYDRRLAQQTKRKSPPAPKHESPGLNS